MEKNEFWGICSSSHAMQSPFLVNKRDPRLLHRQGPSSPGSSGPDIGWCVGPVREENRDPMLTVAQAP